LCAAKRHAATLKRGCSPSAERVGCERRGPIEAITTAEHDHDSLDPTIRARDCVYEHIQVVFEHLRQLGYDVAIDVPEEAFDELERVES
jgi:hypothetical protein